MRSTTRSFGLLLAAAVGAALFGGQASAAGYPEHPINFIVPWGPGGGADLLARTAGKIMSARSRRLGAGAQRAGRHRHDRHDQAAERRRPTAIRSRC